MIANLYTETKMTVRDGKNWSKDFNVDTGVRQGCVLSPLLFALMVNDLPRVIRGISVEHLPADEH